MPKTAYPLQKSLTKNVGVTKWSRSVSNYFERAAWFAMNGRSPEENSLELNLCRLLAWARSPPRQQEDKAFVTSFGYYLGARKLYERTAVYDNVKVVIFKNWVSWREILFQYWHE